MDQIDQKVHSILQSKRMKRCGKRTSGECLDSLTSLNSTSKMGKGGRRTNVGTAKGNTSAQGPSNTAQTKGKKTIKLK